MIDKITLKKKSITDKELKQIASKSRLKKNIKNGAIYYDNGDTKNFNGGFFIQIDTRGALTVSGSVHKFFNFEATGKLTNYNNITMQQAQQSITKILEYYGLKGIELQVYYFEIGINHETEEPTHKILERFQTLNGKKLYFHPRFKKESLKTTETDKDKKRIFRMYDKLHELKEKRQTLTGVKNLTRYETIYKRQNIPLQEFITNENLKRLEEDFYKEIQELQPAPKVEYIGTGKSSTIKKELAGVIITLGTEKAMQMIKEQDLTPKEYRTRREFIRDWFSKELYKEYKLTKEENNIRNENVTNAGITATPKSKIHWQR